MPLEINLGKSGKREERESKNRNADNYLDAHSTVSEGDRDWRAELRESFGHNTRQSRPSSAAPRGRGRRGGRRVPFNNRPANRMANDSEYHTDFEYSQLSKFGSVDGSTFVVPYMGTFYYSSNSYINLDNLTLKEYIKKQM